MIFNQKPESRKLAIDWKCKVWKCSGGVVVLNIHDSNPNLCKAIIPDETTLVGLWESSDLGETWSQIGWWKSELFDSPGEFSSLIFSE